MPDRFYRLLFIVTLLVCQFSLVMHQADVEHHADGKECTICLASPGLDHALASGFLSPSVDVTGDSPAATPAIPPVSRTPVRLVARSPPTFPLQA